MKSSIQIEQFDPRRESEVNKEVSAGILDEITLFRFAHMSRNANSDGVEAYLSNLNHQLLQRNRMRILQMYLVPEDEPCSIEIEKIGWGELVSKKESS